VGENEFSDLSALNDVDSGLSPNDNDVLTYDTASGEWGAEPAAGGGGGGGGEFPSISIYSDDSSHSSNSGSLHFMTMANKTQAELVTDGWVLNNISGSPATIENVNGSGLRFFNPSGASNYWKFPITGAGKTQGCDMVALIEWDWVNTDWPSEHLVWGIIDPDNSLTYFFQVQKNAGASGMPYVTGWRNGNLNLAGAAAMGAYTYAHSPGQWLFRFAKPASVSTLYAGGWRGQLPSLTPYDMSGWNPFTSTSNASNFDHFFIGATGGASAHLRWSRRLK
jgi:hypothetical protein